LSSATIVTWYTPKKLHSTHHNQPESHKLTSPPISGAWRASATLTSTTNATHTHPEQATALEKHRDMSFDPGPKPEDAWAYLRMSMTNSAAIYTGNWQDRNINNPLTTRKSPHNTHNVTKSLRQPGLTQSYSCTDHRSSNEAHQDRSKHIIVHPRACAVS
jgi:hypothetical protein